MEETEDIRADQLIEGDRVYGFGGIRKVAWVLRGPSGVSFAFFDGSRHETRRNDEIMRVSKRCDVARRSP